MTGLSLCRRYYEIYGLPLLKEKFSDYLDKIACGLVGRGSDAFGFDDDFSRDHDWGPGFCIWITRKTDAQIGNALRKAYDSLPKEFEGYTRIVSANGKQRTGVMIIEDFYDSILGEGGLAYTTSTNLTTGDAPYIQSINYPIINEYDLAAAINGEVFCDPEGIFTSIRSQLKDYYPTAFYLLRLATECATFSQQLEYNIDRHRSRGDMVALFLGLSEGLRSAMHIEYLLNRQYAPHDKWLFHGLKASAFTQAIETIAQNNTSVYTINDTADLLGEQISVMRTYILNRMKAIGLCAQSTAYVGDTVKMLRKTAEKLSVGKASLIDQIVKLEFSAFDQVKNEGGRAFCQDDLKTFSIMRQSQYKTWTEDMLFQYLSDFSEALEQGRNPITEKYGYMEASTFPDAFAKIKAALPPVSEQKMQLINAIVSIQVAFMEAFSQEYPVFASKARTIHTEEDTPYDTSYETYLRGELSTYSDSMLGLYGKFVIEKYRNGQNLARDIMKETATLYGFDSLDAAEQFLK